MIICIYTANAAAVWSYSALRGSLCEVGLPSVSRWRWMINLSLLNGQIPHLPPAFRRCCGQPMTPHRRGNVGPAAHRCTVELLDQGSDVIGVSCHKEVPGSPLVKRSTETMAMIAIFVGIICWNVSDSRAVLAGRFRHQLGPFLYILWAVSVCAVLVDTGRFGPWFGPFWRWSVFVHSSLDYSQNLLLLHRCLFYSKWKLALLLACRLRQGVCLPLLMYRVGQKVNHDIFVSRGVWLRAKVRDCRHCVMWQAERGRWCWNTWATPTPRRVPAPSSSVASSANHSRRSRGTSLRMRWWQHRVSGHRDDE